MDIFPLSAQRQADFMAFMEGKAFSDNRQWSSCYCQCFYEDHAKVHWAARTAVENRAMAVHRIQHGSMQGLLAYDLGSVVGWCNAAVRTQLHALDCEPVANAAQVGTILCFLVAPTARGRGVATALLQAACQHFEDQGLLVAEANPRSGATGAGANHYGPLEMYLRAGFTVARNDADGSVWVRKALGRDGP